jgi:hypothetical protein
MAYTWDRLHHRIDELEKQNRKLRGMLSDAIGICDAAIDGDDASRNALQGFQDELPLAEAVEGEVN